MKLILSRKGFDTSAGGMPSPILPDGRMVSLPIPDKQSPIRYADIEFHGESIAPLVSDLTHEGILSRYGAHLDPDLSAGNLPRPDGWRPIFGQTSAAQGHLRRTTLANGKYQWLKGSPPIHVIWGWLQIGEVLPVDISKGLLHDWAAYHPHCHRGPNRNNVIYVSSRHLSLGHGVLENPFWCGRPPGLLF